jgi:hypothetical protein
VIFVGKDSTVNLNRLGVIVFDRALVNLPLATEPTPPLSSTISFYGFKTSEIHNPSSNDFLFIMTAPDFPNLVLACGFKVN